MPCCQFSYFNVNLNSSKRDESSKADQKYSKIDQIHYMFTLCYLTGVENRKNWIFDVPCCQLSYLNLNLYRSKKKLKVYSISTECKHWEIFANRILLKPKIQKKVHICKYSICHVANFQIFIFYIEIIKLQCTIENTEIENDSFNLTQAWKCKNYGSECNTPCCQFSLPNLDFYSSIENEVLIAYFENKKRENWLI